MTRLLALLLLVAAASAQPQPDTLWTRINASDSITIQAIDCEVSASGAVFVTGTTYNHDNGRGTGWVQKRSSTGDLLWTSYTLADDQQFFYSVLPTPDGGCVGAGSKYSEGLPQRSFAAKYSASGEREWLTILSLPPGVIVATSYPLITAAPDGFYLGLNGTDSSFFRGYIAAARFDMNGDTLWTRMLDVSGRDEQIRHARTVNGELHLGVQTLAGDLPESAVFARLDAAGNLIDANEYETRYAAIYGFVSDAGDGAAFLLRTYDASTERMANELLQVAPDGTLIGSTVLPWPVYADSATYYFGDLCRTPAGGYAAGGIRAVPDGQAGLRLTHVVAGVGPAGDGAWLRELLLLEDRNSDVANTAIALAPDSSYVLAADRGYTFFPINSIVIKTGPDRGNGRIAGVVRSARDFQPVFNATVRTRDGAFQTTTLPGGEYDLRLPAGVYELVIEKAGYCATSVTDVVVIGDEDQLRDFTLNAPTFLCNATSLNLQWAGETIERSFLVANANGNCPLEFVVEEDVPWLTVTPRSDTLAPEQTTDMLLTISEPLPPAGDYTEQVRFVHNAEGSEFILTVTLVIPLELGDLAHLPQTTVLHPAYPNPFNPATQLAFELKHSGPVSLLIYDVRGRLVASLVDGTLAAGSYTREFRPKDAASGVYIALLRTTDVVRTQKLLLLK